MIGRHHNQRKSRDTADKGRFQNLSSMITLGNPFHFEKALNQNASQKVATPDKGADKSRNYGLTPQMTNLTEKTDSDFGASHLNTLQKVIDPDLKSSQDDRLNTLNAELPNDNSSASNHPQMGRGHSSTMDDASDSKPARKVLVKKINRNNTKSASKKSQGHHLSDSSVHH